SAPVNLSNSSGTSGWPRLAADAANTLHLVWEDNSSGNDEILYSGKPASGSWSAPVNLSQSSGSSLTPSLAEQGGALHAVWTDNTSGNFEVMYASKPAGAAWSTPLNLSQSSGLSGSPAITVDQRGNVAAVWNDDSSGNFEVMYASKPAGGSW